MNATIRRPRAGGLAVIAAAIPFVLWPSGTSAQTRPSQPTEGTGTQQRPAVPTEPNNQLRVNTPQVYTPRVDVPRVNVPTLSPQGGKPPLLDSSTAPVAEPGRAPITSPVTSAAEYRRRLSLRRLQQTGVALAAQLRREARRAFEQGLLPLDDYARHLNLVRDLETAVADDNLPARLRAHAEHSGQLLKASAALRRFRQPGATGWGASVIQAELLTAEATLNFATTRKDRAGAGRTLTRARDLARQHYQARRVDYNAGLAGTLDVVQAVNHLVTTHTATVDQDNSGAPLNPATWQLHDDLRTLLADTLELASQGRAVGREADAHAARLQIARATALLEARSGNKPAAVRALQIADSAAKKLFEKRSRLVDSGTASLFDVAGTWRQWRELDTLARQLELDSFEPSTNDRNRGRAQLTRLAARETDRRGRLAADLAFVQGLTVLEVLRAQHASAQEGNVTPARDAPAETQSESSAASQDAASVNQPN